ncbi:MAG TPA: hypothetical protein VH478_13520 [Trebonia sp.]|jgi:hypothetical protein|nr:hypothetical protein [Trebonia sp.]
MKAIVPLNVAALRVSSPDSTNVTPGAGFAGRTAAFDLLPHGSRATQASTGDTIWLPLGQGSPSVPLETGVHLHWELPEYFKRGRQDPATGAIAFPPAPTRWLVTRSLATWDAAAGRYGAPRPASWVVESDYVSATLPPGPDGIPRPAVPVPLTAPDGTPFMYLGRVVEAARWDPAAQGAASYLPHYTGPGGTPLYLTSIGFVGAAFSGYYPDCRSVFGFWDAFADEPGLHAAITGNNPVRFRASYTVIGWLPDPARDPLAGLADDVASQYGQYLSQAREQRAKVTSTPADVFARVTASQYGWQFSDRAVSYTLGDGDALATLDVPDGTLCAGTMQDVVWDQAGPAAGVPFLATPAAGQPWTDQVEIAIGNTTVQAVSALVKSHLDAPGGAPVLASYETLLNALQLGMLRDLEVPGSTLATLEQSLHERAFSAVDGGHRWTITATAAPGAQASPAVTLPLALAERLAALNAAQLAYDQARSRLLAAREQLFMDWVIYVKQFCRTPPGTDVVPANTLGAFLGSATAGELHAVIAAAAATGLLRLAADAGTGRITGVATADPATTLAGQVAAARQAVATALAGLAEGWELDAVPADPFWQPTDPVLVLEGNRLDPARRNGPGQSVAVRVDGELIARLRLGGAPGEATVTAGAPPGVAAPPAGMPSGPAAAAVLAEAALLDPGWAAVIAAAAGQGPLAPALAACQGGGSPLDGATAGGLYAAVRAAGYQRAADPAASATAPGPLTVTFTGASGPALPPDPVGWNAQAALPEFSATRADPFLPVWMTWELRLDPLARDAAGGYPAGTLADRFVLGDDEIDLAYAAPAAFTTRAPVSYQGTVVLSKKPFVSLTEQISRYQQEFPGDAAGAGLARAQADLAGRKVLAQALDTFSLAQTLRTTIPQIPVADLVRSPDPVTKAIAAAATATAGDNWYASGFNGLTAISAGPQAQYNYGPLRAGFLEITRLTLVDAFGQVMELTTAADGPGAAAGTLPLTPAADLAPAAGDAANAGRAYLPPRVLAPARVSAQWLSARHDPAVAGFSADFAEAGDHPATSPVCGWIVPNHLDVSLAFYDAGGSPVGSFGLEHGASTYRTRAGNLANPGDDLDADLGPVAAPRVNPHVARLMRFVARQPAGFLAALMAAIEGSDQFINPASATQDASLAVLVGRPLAIVRTAQSLATAGGVLPASQASTTKADALSAAVAGKWYDYGDRSARTTAGLGQVSIPVRLGELTDVDDGLVAFLPEEAGDAPYSVVYAAAGPAAGASGVLRPGPDTVELTLNGPARTFTMIVDPRAPVHVTTGILPTVSMQVPPDQYLRAMRELSVAFTTRPVLAGQPGLRLPLPAQAGFTWSWVAAGDAPAPLAPPPAPDVPSYGYSPQQLLEGWLDLIPDSPQPSDGSQ